MRIFKDYEGRIESLERSVVTLTNSLSNLLVLLRYDENRNYPAKMSIDLGDGILRTARIYPRPDRDITDIQAKEKK